MTRPNQQIVSKILLALFSVSLTLIGLELALRIISPPQTGIQKGDRPAIRYYSDEERLNPWSQGHVNPLRIAVVGDSVTFGTGNQYYDAYPWRLELLLNLNKDQRPAQIKVWAQGGNSPRLELRYLPEIKEWNPDILILGICLNDAENAARNRELAQWRAETLPPPPPSWLAPLLRPTRVGSLIYQKWASRKARQGYIKYYQRIYNKAYSGWLDFEKALLKFNRFSQEEDIRFLPVIFPLFTDVDRYPFDWVHAQIGALLNENNITYIDLLEHYRGQDPKRLQAIPYIDGHPNEIAHRQAADYLFNYLLANKLIDQGYTPRNTQLSPEGLWKMLDQYLYNVVDVKRDKDHKLLQPVEGNQAKEPLDEDDTLHP